MERLIGFDPQFLADSAITGFAVLFLFFILSYLLFNPAKEMLKKEESELPETWKVQKMQRQKLMLLRRSTKKNWPLSKNRLMQS